MADAIEKRSRYLRDFAASVSHEFKTPPAAISGAIELLQDHRADMAPADQERFLRNMAADAQRLSRLVRRLMELARADVLVGERDAQAEVLPILASAADALAREGFAIHVQVSDALPSLAIDAGALEAVLTILAENARQAGASRLEMTVAPQDDMLWIDIADDGPGISQGDQNRIFDPFFTSKRYEGGTGLGLAIARSLLDAYRGELQLMPTAHGAHFRIACPTV